MKLAIVTGSIFFALTGSSAAQPGMTPYAPPQQPAPAPAGEALSEGTALALSLGGTIVPWALAIGGSYASQNNDAAAGTIGLVASVGIIIGPSLGHWYAGKYFTRGMGLRLGGGALVFVGGLLFAAAMFGGSNGEEASEMDDGTGTAGIIMAISGFGLFVGGTIDDVITAPGRVRRHNEARTGYAIAPVVTGQGAGLALGGTF